MKKKRRAIKLNDKTFIGELYRPYVIAELNTSHFGDLKTAKKIL